MLAFGRMSEARTLSYVYHTVIRGNTVSRCALTPHLRHINIWAVKLANGPTLDFTPSKAAINSVILDFILLYSHSVSPVVKMIEVQTFANCMLNISVDDKLSSYYVHSSCSVVLLESNSEDANH